MARTVSEDGDHHWTISGQPATMYFRTHDEALRVARQLDTADLSLSDEQGQNTAITEALAQSAGAVVAATSAQSQSAGAVTAAVAAQAAAAGSVKYVKYRSGAFSHGPIAFPGVKVGDHVTLIRFASLNDDTIATPALELNHSTVIGSHLADDVTGDGGPGAPFEIVITVDDQIQQLTDTDLTNVFFLFVITRP